MEIIQETDIPVSLREYKEVFIDLYGIHLESIILYGFYARGGLYETA